MPQYARANPAKWWHTRWVGSAHRSPASMFISPARRLATLALLLLLLSLITGVWYLTNSKRISHMAQTLLSNVLGGQVEIGSGHLSFAGTLELTGVKLRPSTNPGAPTLFSADQVKVRFDWLSLLTGELRATQITATRPTLNLVEDLASRAWNYEGLARRPNPRGPSTSGPTIALPVILLREARIEWGETENGQYTVTGTTVIDGQFNPNALSPHLYQFTVEQRPDPLNPLWSDPSQGLGLISGTWDMDASRFTAVINTLPLASGLEHSLPRAVGNWWHAHQISGALHRFEIHFNPDDGLELSVDLDRVCLIQPLHELLPNPKTDLDIPLEDISGQIKFGIKKQEIELLNLHGKVFHLAFNADGEIRGAPKPTYEVRIRLPDALIPDEYPEFFHIFKQTQDLINRLHPHGVLDLEVNIRKTEQDLKPIVNGAIDCKGLHARFVHFPYPLHDFKGRVSFDNNSIHFEHVTALADENPITITGLIGITGQNHAVDLHVSSDQVYIDDRLAYCLPPQFLPIWTRFNPTGLIKFDCAIRRENTPDSHQTIHVDVTPLDAFASYRDFPYPLEHVHGHFILEDNQATIDELTAPVSSGHITLKGKVFYPHGNLEAVRPEIDATAVDVPLNRNLLDALPESYEQWSRLIDIAGRLNFIGTIQRGPDSEPMVQGNLNLEDAEINARSNLWAVHHLNATTHLAPGQIQIETITANIGPDGKSLLALQGAVTQSPQGLNLNLNGHWHDLLLEPTPPALLPPPLAATWDHYRPDGKLDGDFHFTALILADKKLPPISDTTTAPAITEPTSTPSPFSIQNSAFTIPTFSIELRPQQLALAPRSWPDSLSNITGTILLTPQTLTFTNLNATSGPAHIQTTGTYSLPTQTLTLKANMDSTAFPAKWLALLPNSAAKVITSYDLQSPLTLDLPQFCYSRDPQNPQCSFTGSLTLPNLKTSSTMITAANQLTLTGTGDWNAKLSGLDFTGKLTANQMAITKQSVTAVSSTLLASAADKTISLNEITGQVAKGAIHGSMQIWSGENPHYKGSLLLSDANLTTLLLPPNASEEEKQHIGTGRVTANLAVQEQFGNEATRTGRGELVIRDANFYNVPLAMGLMQLVTLRVPLSRAFNNAQMSYYIRDNKVTFEKIVLQSPGINLVGLGTLAIKDRSLDLRFVTESSELFDIPFLNLIRNQLLQLQVTGTAEAPKITPIPLDAISSTLELLLPRRKSD